VLDPSGDDESVGGCQDIAIGLGRIVVGCPTTTHQPPSLGPGAVFLFERSGPNWIETSILTPPNGFGDADNFGFRVDVQGDQILVGAPGWTDAATRQSKGAAYLYTRLGGSWINTGFFPGDVAGAASSSSRGLDVAIEGPTLAVGDGGYARSGAVGIYGAPVGRFEDDEASLFETAIDWLASQGITTGCNPPLNTQFCPDAQVTRGQMAAFLVRAFGYTDDGGGDLFIDDDSSVFESAIDRLGAAGVTFGCNPPANDRFCPDDPVNRGQMAAFLVRAFGYSDAGAGNYFVDDDGTVFEGAIDRLRVGGVTFGCNPPTNDRFCPDDLVTRGQMAAFLMRAITG
jgi:hypothetical protein